MVTATRQISARPNKLSDIQIESDASRFRPITDTLRRFVGRSWTAARPASGATRCGQPTAVRTDGHVGLRLVRTPDGPGRAGPPRPAETPLRQRRQKPRVIASGTEKLQSRDRQCRLWGGRSRTAAPVFGIHPAARAARRPEGRPDPKPTRPPALEQASRGRARPGQ